MKKILFFLSLLSFLSINHAIADSFDFRQTKWGMSKEEVISSEEKKPDAAIKNIILYNDIAAINLKCTLGYEFADDNLTMAGYHFTTEHSNDNDHIDDFKRIKELLIKKYGTPKIDNETWQNDTYMHNPQLCGFAISSGHLIYSAVWETENTEIYLMLFGKNYIISHSLNYFSKAFKEL